MNTKAQTENENKIDVLTSFIKQNCNENIEHIQLLESFETLLFFREQLNKSIQKNIMYIGSENFHEDYSAFNGIKVQLISAISNL
jgi:hypothetical protein